MATTEEDVTTKAKMVEIEPKIGIALKPQTPKEEVNDTETEVGNGLTEKEKVNYENGMKAAEEPKNANDEEDKAVAGGKEPNGDAQKEEVPLEIEPKTGVSFPVTLDDGKKLNAIGLRKKSMLGLGIKIYSYGIYADNNKLRDLMKSTIGKAPVKPTKEMYQTVIDSDVGMMVRLVIVFSNLTMSMVRKNFDEGLGAAIKKLTGGKNDELTKKIMGQTSDDIKLTPGSVIEISRFPGYTLQTKVMGEVVSTVESELLCRAYIYLYLGEDPFDKEAKEKFGMSLLSLFLSNHV